MMKCTPKYRVSYKGVFYAAGCAFDIDPADAEEMSKHGKCEDVEEKPKKKPGRPKKN